jgi:ABC-2 type transport system permease protein
MTKHRKILSILISIYKDITRGFALVYRNYCAARRNFGWFLANTFYYVISGLSIVFIGVASKDPILTINLFIGVLVWDYLSTIFDELSQSITYEKWEGTIEYTFMAPISRASHLFSISLYSLSVAFIKSLFLAIACLYMFDLNFTSSQYVDILLILALSTVSFIGLGLLAAILPLLNTENGGQAVFIFQGLLLLVSGVYYPVEILPKYIQFFSWFSPATYAIEACRAILINHQTLSSVSNELLVLILSSCFLIPFGLYMFSIAERYTKKYGKLKRNG